jgi:hypothetical protein
MVSDHVGGTTKKVRELFEAAVGGVLMIDEAYGLGQMGFGNEAIDMITGLLTQYQEQVCYLIRILIMTWLCIHSNKNQGRGADDR